MTENKNANNQTEQKMTRKIGSTVYEVTVHFSNTSKENINDKILRLIKNDIAKGKAAS